MTGQRTSMLRVHYTDPHGTPQVCTVQDATGVAFEDCPAVRAIESYPGQWHTPGQYWSATTGTLLAYESFLECQWLTMLDFEPTIAAINTQALEVRGRDHDGAWRHVPDVFARRVNGSVLIVDVKHPRRRDSPTVARQEARTADACRQLGWDYRMVDAPPAQRHANIAWLAGYRRPLHAVADLEPEIVAAVAQPVRIGNLAARVPDPLLARPVIFHLLWRHRLVCDLDTPLREDTLVWSAEGASR